MVIGEHDSKQNKSDSYTPKGGGLLITHRMMRNIDNIMAIMTFPKMVVYYIPNMILSRLMQINFLYLNPPNKKRDANKHPFLIIKFFFR